MRAVDEYFKLWVNVNKIKKNLIEYYSHRNDYEHIIALRDDNIIDLYSKYTKKAQEAAKVQAKLKNFMANVMKVNMLSIQEIEDQIVKKQMLL